MSDSQSIEDPRPASASILRSALQFGALTGFVGTAIGGTAGVLRSSTPGLFALASGLQCFTLGSSYWAARQTLLQLQAARRQHGGGDAAQVPARRRTQASAVAGGVAGGVTAALFRGRANVMPGVVVFAAVGGIGQAVYGAMDARHATRVRRAEAESEGEAADGVWSRIVASRWNPVKRLGDEEYEGMLQEKLIRVEAEIALVEEDLARMKGTPQEPEP